MQHSTDSFKTPNKLQIHTESWLPVGDPRAVVLIVHGYAEHIGRYAHVAERFVEQGYAVYGLDHQGHGKSDGLRAYFDSLDTPVQDLKTYFDSIKATHPHKKIFMWGHSMGSLIAMTFTLKYPQALAGLILSGTAVDGEKLIPAPVIALARLLTKVIPKTRLVPALAADAISHDPKIVEAYNNDSLVDRGAWRVGMGYTLIAAGRQLRQQASQLRLPLLILHGGTDKITPVSGAEAIHQQAASSDKTLKIYPNLFHEVHNELGKDAVLNDMLAWLNQHIN